MGLFGGGNSSKSSTNNIDNRATNAAGNSGLAVGGDNNKISVLDGGAVNSAIGGIVSVNESSLNFANDFGESAFDLVGNTMSESYGFASSQTDQAFDAIDKVSEQSFSFVADAFDSALYESRMSRESAVGAALESNARIADVYATAGRESSSQSFDMIKVVAVLVGVIGLGVLLRA